MSPKKSEAVTEVVEVVEKKSEKTLAARLEEEGDVAADYLEGLLDIADLDGDIEIGMENDRATLSIEGGELNHLVGREGEVLDSIQELTRLAVQTATGERSRLMLDIDGFRVNKKETLAELALKIAEEVKASGESVKLAPMNAFERKVIHDTIQINIALVALAHIHHAIKVIIYTEQWRHVTREAVADLHSLRHIQEQRIAFDLSVGSQVSVFIGVTSRIIRLRDGGCGIRCQVIACISCGSIHRLSAALGIGCVSN